MTETRARPEIMELDGLVLRPLVLDEDAAALAQMWNASDDQWPGTWSGGVPVTAEMVIDRLTREDALEHLIWDAGGVIAGYCSLWKDPEYPSVARIQLLNVPPQFQKRGLARRILTHYVARVAEMGFARLDLYSWPGNEKAVPTYKKSGFFWLPDRSYLQMLNFMPSILKMPLLQDYFAHNDWYSSFRRELSQEPDEERWEGMKVFTYRFGDDDVVVRIDREAHAITAVETSLVAVASIVREADPPRGLPATLTWRVENRRDAMLTATMIGIGSQHLALDHREELALGPRESREVDIPVQVAVEVPDRDVEEHKPAPGVRTLLVSPDLSVDLASGMRPQPAVEPWLHLEGRTPAPGVPAECRLQLRNRLKQPVEVAVSITAPEGVDASWSRQTVRLEAEGRAGVPLTLTGAGEAAYEIPVTLQVEASGRSLTFSPEPLRFAVLTPGGVLAWKSEDEVVVRSELASLHLSRQGAGLSIMTPDGKWLASEEGWPTPPSMPTEYPDAYFDLDLRTVNGRFVVHASTKSKNDPGIVLHKWVEASAGPVVAVRYEIENLSSSGRRLQLTQSVGFSGRTLTLPLARGGITAGAAGDFPGRADTESKKPGFLSEEWAHSDTFDGSVGIVWAPDFEQLAWDWGMSRRGTMLDVPAQGRVRPEPLLLQIGADMAATRSLWERTTGRPRQPNAPAPEPRPHVNVMTEPSPVVSLGEAVQVTLVSRSLTTRVASGSVELVVPEGWSSDPQRVDLSEITWKRDSVAPVRFTPPPRPDAGFVKAVLETEEATQSFDLPLLRLGDGSDVQVSEADSHGTPVLTIANGLIEVDVAPSFSGCATSLRAEGAEQLLSAFPKAGVLGWMSPWHGGLSPVLTAGGGFPGVLHTQ
ncbi:MAG TPA: GNAT family N-acetyltransferase, partial [Actinomycetota bacterium]|nr:GNAT family N-acetyltransferase [Actinomycetota bacterium]